jgi:WD40 repeat protein
VRLERLWEITLPDFAQALSFAPGGEVLGAATLAGPVVFVDGHTGETHWATEGHAGGALSLAWSPHGRWVATGGQDARVAIVDVAAQTVVAELDAPGGWVSHLAWSPDGTTLAAASGPCVHFWSHEWERIGEGIEQASSVTALFFHPETGWAVACYGGMQLLEPGSQRPRERYPFRGSVIAALPSPDGGMVALGSQDATVRLWDRRRRNDASLTGYPGKVAALAWAERAPLLATAGGKEVVVWGCGGHGPRGTVPAKLTGHTGRVTSLAFLDERLELVSGGLDGRLGVWECEEAWRSADWIETPAPVHSLVRHGDRLVAASAGGSVTMWSH